MVHDTPCIDLMIDLVIDWQEDMLFQIPGELK